ncbi:hypothetical protein [Nostoc sp.]
MSDRWSCNSQAIALVCVRITPLLIPGFLQLAHTPVTVPNQGLSASQMVGLAILRSQPLLHGVVCPPSTMIIIMRGELEAAIGCLNFQGFFSTLLA